MRVPLPRFARRVPRPRPGWRASVLVDADWLNLEKWRCGETENSDLAEAYILLKHAYIRGGPVRPSGLDDQLT